MPFALLAAHVFLASTSPYLYGNVLAVLVVVALGWLLVRQWFPPLVAWAWPLALSALGLVGFAIGTANGNPGARATLTVFVIEPLVLGLAFALASRERGWRPRLLGLLDATTVAIFAAGVWIYLARHLGLPVPSLIYGDRFTAVDATGLLRTNYQGFNAFVFLAPYAVARCLRPLDEPAWRRVLVLVAGVGGVILSGRQVLFLLVPAAVGAALVLALLEWVRARQRESTEVRRRRPLDLVGTVGAVASVVAIVAGGHMLASAELSGSEAPGATEAESTEASPNAGKGTAAGRVMDSGGVRSEQSTKLLDHWRDSPWWGHGTGAAVPDYVRSEEAPWRFELGYHVVLMGFGVIGAVILVAWALWIAIPLVRAAWAHDRAVQAVVAGWVGTLLAAATNPYLLHIDGMWLVMVPFGLAVAMRRPVPDTREAVS